MDFLLRFLAAGQESEIAEEAFEAFTNIVNIILPLLMSLLLLLGMFYGITPRKNGLQPLQLQLNSQRFLRTS